MELYPGQGMANPAQKLMQTQIENLTNGLIEGGIIDKGPGKWGTDESYNTDFHRDITQLVRSAWE